MGLKLIAAIALFFAIPASSEATVRLGDTVTCSGSFTCSSSIGTIGSSYPTFTFGDFTANFDSNILFISYDGNHSFSVADERDQFFSDIEHPITSADLLFETGLILGSFGQPNISVANNILEIHLGEFAAPPLLTPGSGFTIALGSSVASVPELDTWSMMIVGIGLIGLRQRRQNRHVVHA